MNWLILESCSCYCEQWRKSVPTKYSHWYVYRLEWLYSTRQYFKFVVNFNVVQSLTLIGPTTKRASISDKSLLPITVGKPYPIFVHTPLWYTLSGCSKINFLIHNNISKDMVLIIMPPLLSAPAFHAGNKKRCEHEI